MSFLRLLTDKWQIPLLAIGLLLVLTGLPRLLLKPVPVNLEDEISRARQALADGRAPEAIHRVDVLAHEALSDSQRTQTLLIRGLAHYLLATDAREATQRAYARQAIADMDRAARLAGSVDALDSRLTGPAEFFVKRGQAKIWSLDSGEADLLEALNRLAAGQDALRRQIIELLWTTNPAVVHRELDGLLTRTDLLLADQLWTIRKKAQLLVKHGWIEEAEDLLEQRLVARSAGASQDALEILLARVCFESVWQHGDKLSAGKRERKLDKAFLLLSAVELRRAAVPGEEEIDAELNWLLGEVHFVQGRPNVAKEKFDRVVRQFSGTPYTRAARLGVARCAAAYGPIEPAYDAYEQVVHDLVDGPDDPLVDRRAVRASLLSLAEQLQQQEQWEPAYRFLALLYPMIDPSEAKPSQGDLKEKQGRLLRRLAAEEKQSADRLTRQAGARTSSSSQPADVAHLNAQARRHLGLAAEAFLDAARLVTSDDQRSGDDLEIAAACYDEAGLILQAIVVLNKFIRDYPSDQSRVARAVFNLAKSYQGAGQYDRAITQYQLMISQYPNSPDANKSLVPLAQCHKSLGQFDQAEKVLLDVLGDDQRYSPDSKEYVAALFELAKLKYERRQFRQAIARFDELLQRQIASPLAVRYRYHLADSYRLAGIELDGAIASARNVIERGQFAQMRSLWLGQAKECFDQVITALEARSTEAGERIELDELYLRNAYFFRADCLFDLGLYGEAVDLYDLAALKYHDEPEAVAAYVQIVNCYQRMDKPEQARTANERAKWMLKKLSPDTFARRPLPLGKDYFAQWLEWAGKSGTW